MSNIIWGVRLFLGAVFIYAGLLKVIAPVSFMDAVARFKIAPPPMIYPIAVGLPVFEILVGVMVLLLVEKIFRLGVFAVIILDLFFMVLLIVSLLRGLSVKCRCFRFNMLPTSK